MGMGVGEGVVFVFLRIFGGVWFGVGGRGEGGRVVAGLSFYAV